MRGSLGFSPALMVALSSGLMGGLGTGAPASCAVAAFVARPVITLTNSTQAAIRVFAENMACPALPMELRIGITSNDGRLFIRRFGSGNGLAAANVMTRTRSAGFEVAHF